MSVGKRAAIGAAVIVVLFGAAIAVVDRLLAEPTGAPPPRQEPLQLEAPAQPPLEPLPPPPAAAPLPEAPPPAGPRPAAPAPAPLQVPQGKDLLTTLDAARARILECGGVDPELARPGGAARRAGLDPNQPRTVLLLDLEPLQGELAVRDIEVVSVGGHDGEDLIRCARQELSGRVFEATAARPGQHMKMQFVVDRLRR